jgi:very-short-patch-repair endonuclease
MPQSKSGKSKSSKLEDWLFEEFASNGLPIPQRQYQFHPTRKWRLDFAWPERKLAIEVEGGIYMRGGGRHNRGAAMEQDFEKHNTAQLMGWRVFRFGPKACRRSKRTGLMSDAMAFMFPILRRK